MTRPGPAAVTADYSDHGWPARPGPGDRTITYETCTARVRHRLGGHGPCGQPATWRTSSPGHRAWWCDTCVPDDAVAAWRRAAAGTVRTS